MSHKKIENPLKFTWQFTVLETHLDTFGHMNHATYLQIFEQARWEFITARGFGLKEIHERQIGPTILGLTIQYKRELRLRETVTIESVCSEYSGKIGKVQQRMLNSKGEEAATIELTVGLFDMKSRKLITGTPEWMTAIGVPLTL
jgi:acyl-CoA thioester hydrolase